MPVGLGGFGGTIEDRRTARQKRLQSIAAGKRSAGGKKRRKKR